MHAAILMCPSCRGELEISAQSTRCTHCQVLYPNQENGIPDLRLRQPKTVALDFTIPPVSAAPGNPAAGIQPLAVNSTPEVDFSGVIIPRHLTVPLLSHFPRAKENGALALDLGCGEGIHRAVIEKAGFSYVGLDYDLPRSAGLAAHAPYLGDAHALPFRDASFEFILSVAVLEHIRYPFVMMKEVYRVLKPGGRFIGTAAFMEPFHQNSFSHPTHLGLVNLLSYGGFAVEQIAPDRQWTGLAALAKNGLFPRMPAAMIKLVLLPVVLAQKLWWGLARKDDAALIRNTSGSFAFIASK